MPPHQDRYEVSLELVTMQADLSQCSQCEDVAELEDDILCFLPFFFHEYGRRVGMVPRSSLKEGKKRQMVEKGTKTPKTNPKPNTQARRPTPPSCSLPYTLGETCETETSDN